MNCSKRKFGRLPSEKSPLLVTVAVASHESLYERTPLTAVPTGQLLDCPLLLLWPDGPAAAITEARVRDFAGMYQTDYGTPAADADVCTARPELGLPDILAYARKQGVGIRLWVHWKPLSKQLPVVGRAGVDG